MVFKRPSRNPFDKPLSTSPYQPPQRSVLPEDADEESEEAGWRAAQQRRQTAVDNLELEEPETTLGEGVQFNGRLQFSRLLRIDGTFEGELISQGKLVVGPKGIVRSNVELEEALIEGQFHGNITVKERLELRGEASVVGNIKAQYLVVEEGVSIEGQVSVKPALPISNP